MAACKYVILNGRKIQIDIANEVMKLKAMGYSNAQIASQLNLSEADVVNIATRG